MAGYDTVPQSAQLKPQKFHLEVPEQELSDFKALLRASKLAPATYESSQTDGSFGVTHEWMTTTKDYWQNKYDWYVPTRGCLKMNGNSILVDDLLTEVTQATTGEPHQLVSELQG